MIIVGLLSSKQEVQEIKYIAQICKVEDRIHFIIRMKRIKEMIQKEQMEE